MGPRRRESYADVQPGGRGGQGEPTLYAWFRPSRRRGRRARARGQIWVLPLRAAVKSAAQAPSTVAVYAVAGCGSPVRAWLGAHIITVERECAQSCCTLPQFAVGVIV